MARAEPPSVRASMRMAGDEATRGTTSAVKTLHAVKRTRAMPAMSATRRANDSTASSCQMPGRSGPGVSSARGEPCGDRPARHKGSRHLHRSRTQQLPQALRLRVQAQIRGDPPAKEAMDDEVHRTEVRERVAADRVGLHFGQQRLEQRNGEAML